MLSKRRWIGLAAVGLAFCLLTPAAYGWKYNVPATYVYYRDFDLTAGVRYTFETRNTTRGGDPFMHLFSLAANREVARNNNRTWLDLNSKITYTPTATGTYRLVVRPDLEAEAGVTDIYYNGEAYETRVPFRGAFVGKDWLTEERYTQPVVWEKGEVIRTVSSGTVDPVLYLFDWWSHELLAFNNDQGSGHPSGPLFGPSGTDFDARITTASSGCGYIIVGSMARSSEGLVMLSVWYEPGSACRWIRAPLDTVRRIEKIDSDKPRLER